MIIPLLGAIANRHRKYFLTAICLKTFLPSLVLTAEYLVDYEGADCSKSYSVGNFDVFRLEAKPRNDINTGKDRCFNQFLATDNLKLKIYVKTDIRSCGIFLRFFDGDPHMNKPRWTIGCNTNTQDIYLTYSSELIVRLDKPVSDSTNSYSFTTYITNEKGPVIDFEEKKTSGMDGGVSGGVIAGIAVGVGLVVIVIIVIIVIVAYRWMKKKEKEHKPYKPQTVFTTTSAGGSVRFGNEPPSSRRIPSGSSQKYKSSSKAYSSSSHDNHGYEASVDSSVTSKKINPLPAKSVDGKKFINEEKHEKKIEPKPNQVKGKSDVQPRDQPDSRHDRRYYDQGKKSMISSDELTSSSDYRSQSERYNHDNQNKWQKSRTDSRDRQDYQMRTDDSNRQRSNSASHSKSRRDRFDYEDDGYNRDRTTNHSVRRKRDPHYESNGYDGERQHRSSFHRSTSRRDKFDYEDDGYHQDHTTNRSVRRKRNPDYDSNGYDSERHHRNSFHRSSSSHRKSRRDHSYDNYDSEGEILRSIPRQRNDYERRGYESDGGNRRSLHGRRDGNNRRYNTDYESDGGHRQSVRNRRRYNDYDSEDGLHKSVSKDHHRQRKSTEYNSDEKHLGRKQSHRHRPNPQEKHQSDYDSDHSRRSDHRRRQSSRKYDNEFESRGHQSRGSTSQRHRSRSNSHRH